MNLHRRTFLRAAGVALALPLFDALAPQAGPAPPRPAEFRAAWFASTRRWACIRPFFFPEKAGQDYKLSPYLEVFKDFRDDFTVISGLSHPDVGPSHDSNYSFLTAAPHPERRAGFKNTHLARPVRGRTHLRPDAFRHADASCEGSGLSWTRSGAAGADRGLAVERVRQAVSGRSPRRGARPRPAGWPTARASSTRSATRPGR